MIHHTSPVREQIRAEMLTALAGGDAMTVEGLFEKCPTAEDTKELSRIAFEMCGKGLLDKTAAINSRNKICNAYQLTPQGRARATGYPGPTFLDTSAQAIAIPRRVAPGPHPWHQAVVPPKEPQEARVTRPLPLHLQNVREPPAPADSPVDIDAQLIEELRLETAQLEKEQDMTETPAEYEAPIPAFVLESQIEQDMVEALAKDEAQHEAAHLEAARLAIVDAMLIFAHNELRGDRAWKALERAYLAAAGETLEMCHG